MPITTFERITCDRCGEAIDVVPGQQIIMNGWIELRVGELKRPGIGGGTEFKQFVVLCKECRPLLSSMLKGEQRVEDKVEHV